MGVGHKTISWDRVLLDICTQRDFLDAGAILQVANRDEVIAHVKTIFHWAKANRVPVVSSMESHRPAEPMNGFPLHCIDGSDGQRKPSYALMRSRIGVEADNYLSLPPDIHRKYRQIVFRKRTRDVLSNPKADRFLTQLNPEEFIIFGVGLERAIKSLALGLLARHKSVTVIPEACGYWSSADAELSVRQLGAKGIKLITVEELMATPPPKPRRSRLFSQGVEDRHDPAVKTRSRRSRSNVSKG